MSNSFTADGGLQNAAPTILRLNSLDDVSIGNNAQVGLYVEPTTGRLMFGASGAPGVRLFVWLMATSCFPNY
jgi:hypothetical protein